MTKVRYLCPVCLGYKLEVYTDIKEGILCKTCEGNGKFKDFTLFWKAYTGPASVGKNRQHYDQYTLIYIDGKLTSIGDRDV